MIFYQTEIKFIAIFNFIDFVYIKSGTDDEV
jgi:hypothetical protein